MRTQRFICHWAHLMSYWGHVFWRALCAVLGASMPSGSFWETATNVYNAEVTSDDRAGDMWAWAIWGPKNKWARNNNILIFYLKEQRRETWALNSPKLWLAVTSRLCCQGQKRKTRNGRCLHCARAKVDTLLTGKNFTCPTVRKEQTPNRYKLCTLGKTQSDRSPCGVLVPKMINPWLCRINLNFYAW